MTRPLVVAAVFAAAGMVAASCGDGDKARVATTGVGAASTTVPPSPADAGGAQRGQQSGAKATATSARADQATTTVASGSATTVASGSGSGEATTTTTRLRTKPGPDGPGGCEAVDAAAAAARGRRRAAAGTGDPASHSMELKNYLMVDSPVAGLTMAYNGPVNRRAVTSSPRSSYETGQALDTYGFRAGYERNWQRNESFNAVEEYVYEFTDTDSAVAFDDTAIHNLCGAVVATFDVPDVPGAFGVSFLEVTGAPVTEHVSFSRGPRRYVTTRVLKQPPADHSEVIEAAYQAATLAG